MTRDEAKAELLRFILEWLQESGIIDYLPGGTAPGDVQASFADDWQERGIDMILAAQTPDALRDGIAAEDKRREEAEKDRLEQLKEKQALLDVISKVRDVLMKPVLKVSDPANYIAEIKGIVGDPTA